MATENVKVFLFKNTGIPESQWKRISKIKNEDGSELRIFENKNTGVTVETLESKEGNISIIESNSSELKKSNSITKSSTEFTASQIRSSKNLINKFLEEGDEPEENKSGFNAIPTFFNFSFLEDANCDWTEELENISKSNNPNSSVAGVNVFFSFKTKDFEDYNCIHLEPLLYQFLPNFMSEIEESTFHLEEDSIVPYNKFIATLEAKGFTYNKSNCMLANLGGSGGIAPIEPPNFSDIKPKFALLSVVRVSFQDPYPKNPEFITALVIEDENLKTRKIKEKIIKSVLKNYECYYAGRLCNGQIPQEEAIQIYEKRGKDNNLNIFELLIKAGWEFDPSIASIEKARKWKCVEWAITPFEHDDRMFSNALATRSDITYGIWQPPKNKPKI